MSAFWWVLLGIVIGGAISDVVLAVRIYRMFKQTKFRPWPGAGWWMMWKVPVLLHQSRTLIGQIHAAATLFPMTSNLSDKTRDFVATIRVATDLTGGGKTADG